MRIWLPLGIVLLAATAFAGAERGQPWTRHTIDGASRGADGVKLADVNGDGLMDITTGWEEGGVIRVYVNPGHAKAKEKWPAVTAGKVGSPEDAVFADLDGDGAIDVVSACEGKVRSLFVHWAPKDKARYLDPAAWTTEALPAAKGAMMWMFAFPIQLDGKHGLDLVAGAKGGGAQIGWFEAPARPVADSGCPRDLAAWTWHPLRPAGWIMSLIPADMDGDGDMDIVASDRKGPRRGVFWLENPGPGPAQAKAWQEHAIGGQGKEVMFVTLADLDQDGLADVVAATRGFELLYLRRKTRAPAAWEAFPIPLPPNTGTAKGVAVGDIDLDGKPDIVFTCENSRGRSGVMWLSGAGPFGLPPSGGPEAPEQRKKDRLKAGLQTVRGHEISGPVGTKYDLVELIDLDGDGDLDALTCEEAENLGVFWHENPAKR